MSPKILASTHGMYKMGSEACCTRRGPITIPYQTSDYYLARDGKVIEYIPPNKSSKTEK